uniref:Nose resistant-to-fluoxetine protein N-terminal domain-containing protein n=1 Tax=Lepeophtheirus salmonis TaxID=72036 RepID=A0A0K2U1K4_LEPSM
MKIIIHLCLFSFLLVPPLKAYDNSTGTLQYNLYSKLVRDQKYNFLTENHEISLKCRKAIKNLVQSLGKVWAIRMMDATAKIPSGIVSGNINNFGDRKACTRIHGNEQGSENGRYYLILFTNKKSNEGVELFLMDLGNIQYGFCLPQSCSPTDISIGLQTLTGFNVKIIIDDYHEHSLEFEGLEIAFTTLLVFILVFVLAGTMCELYSSLLTIEFDREMFQFLQLFSIISSTKDLFSMPQKTANYKKRLNSLDGMRFLSITWVLIAHFFSASGQRMEDTLTAYRDILGEYFGQTVYNSFNSVDTFFLLSGLLVSYLTIKELERNNGTINWVLYYFHRYVRITLVYAIIVFMFASVLRHLGSTNNIIQMTVDSCRENSWENLLYIENLVSQNFRCIGQGWYLNCDMQMFLITPLILYPLYRWEKIGYVIGAIIILGSTGLLASFHYIKRDLWGATMFGSDIDFFKGNYTQPWMRIQPYIVGVLLGYALFKTKSSFQIPKYGVAIGWILAIAVGYSCIYELHLNEHFLDNSYISIPLPARIVYGSLHRLGWGLAVGWVIFACENGYGGIINEFLSWNFFKPWSKLTFLIYLTHMVVTDLIFDNMI